jgi:WD40 repeat protein
VRATKAEAQATANEQQANKQRDRIGVVNDRLEQTLYAARMNLAKHAWDEGSGERTLELLEQHRPKPGERDLRGFEWYYLDRLCHSDLLTIEVPVSAINSIVFSPDGHLLAGALSDAQVVVWDADTGKIRHTFTGHSHPVRSVVFSFDGKLLVSGSGGRESDHNPDIPGEVKVWDLETGQQALALSDRGQVQSVAMSPDATRIAACSERGAIIWNAQSGARLLEIAKPPGRTRLCTIAFGPDGERLAMGGGKTNFSGEPLLAIWDARTGDKLHDLVGHSAYVNCVAFSSNGHLLASASWDRTARVWDVQTGRELLAINGHSGVVNGVAFSPDGRHIATGSHDATVRIWDSQGGHELSVIKGRSGHVYSLAFSPDGNCLAAAKVSHAPTNSVRFDGAGKLVENARPAGVSAFIHVSEVNRGQDYVSLWMPAGRNYEVCGALSPKGDRLLIACDQTWWIWDTKAGMKVMALDDPNREPEPCTRACSYSPNGKLIALCGESEADEQGKPRAGWVQIWDATSGEKLHTFAQSATAVKDLAFSPDSQHIATAFNVNDHSVKILDTESGQPSLTFRGNNSPIWSVAYSPDGRCVASAGDDTDIKLWDAQTGEELPRLRDKLHGGAYSLAFSPDGKRLASTSYDWTVKIWDTQTGDRLHTLQGHASRVTKAVFSPNGRRLATTSADLSVKIWDTTTGNELLTLRGHREPIGFVAFTPDGRRLITAAVDGEIRIWDATPIADGRSD